MGWFMVITDEMIDWGLSGSELLVFALINGYSQKGLGCYFGSHDNTAKVCGISRATAIRTLQSLTEQGFIRKGKAIVNDELKTTYVATRVSICNQQYQNDTPDGLKMTPYNKEDNINIKRESKSRFVKPTISEVAAFCSERGNDIDAEEFCAFYESKGWLVGKTPMKSWKSAIITWEKSRKKERKFAPKERKRESTFEHNLKSMDAMFGTNYHAEVYGKEVDVDEQ